MFKRHCRLQIWLVNHGSSQSLMSDSFLIVLGHTFRIKKTYNGFWNIRKFCVICVYYKEIYYKYLTQVLRMKSF